MDAKLKRNLTSDFMVRGITVISAIISGFDLSRSKYKRVRPIKESRAPSDNQS